MTALHNASGVQRVPWVDLGNLNGALSYQLKCRGMRVGDQYTDWTGLVEIAVNNTDFVKGEF